MKKIITIIVCFLLLFKPITVYAQEDYMTGVGINQMIKDITEDQAKWAYAKELGELLQQEEVRLMSAIIWCEAGNQDEAGKQAVGIVVMNRVASDKFENDVESVIYEPGQFRPKTDGKLVKALAMYDEGKLPQECIEAAIYALNNNKVIIINGIEIDMSSYLFFATHWDDAKIRIQDHDFK